MGGTPLLDVVRILAEKDEVESEVFSHRIAARDDKTATIKAHINYFFPLFLK